MTEPAPHRDASKSVTDRAAELAKTVSDKAGETAQQVSQAAATASEQVAAQVANEARTAVEEAAGSRKKRAEKFLHSISNAMQAGSNQLDEDGLETTAAYTRKAASMIDGIAGELDGTDISSAARKVEDYMRARPVASFGAAALLGFAAYQLLKGGTSTQATRQ